eukprot:996137_1
MASDSDLERTKKIRQIDNINALRRYYTTLGVNYDSDNNFLSFSETNGIDNDEYLIEELQENETDSFLIDFCDNNFPFVTTPKDEESKAEMIIQILKNCYDDPNWEWFPPIPDFDKDFFRVEEDDIEEFKNILQLQCPAICDMILHNEELLKLSTIGYKHQFEYLLHLVDWYTGFKAGIKGNDKHSLDDVSRSLSHECKYIENNIQYPIQAGRGTIGCIPYAH